jgi:hypothetical protein
MSLTEETRLCFIIACKVYKYYTSYLSEYIKNINIFYPSAFILLVDNNSLYGKEFYKQFDGINNLKIIENISDSKFEQGAYNFGAKYIIDNNLKFEYYICTQDTFNIINKYDFSILKKNNIKAASIYSSKYRHITIRGDYILKRLGLFQEGEEYNGCCFLSYICDHISLLKIYELTHSCIVKYRYFDAPEFEREYFNPDGSISRDKINCTTSDFESSLGKILYILNDKRYTPIECDHDEMKYSTFEINFSDEKYKKLGYCFVKKYQGKTENTPEHI